MIKIKEEYTSLGLKLRVKDNYLATYNKELYSIAESVDFMNSELKSKGYSEATFRFNTYVVFDELERIVKILNGNKYIKWLKKNIEIRDKYYEKLTLYETRLDDNYWSINKPNRPNYKGRKFIDKERNIEINFNFKDGYVFKLLEYIEQYCMYSNPFKLHYNNGRTNYDKTAELIMANASIELKEISQYRIDEELYFEFIVNEPILL